MRLKPPIKLTNSWTTSSSKIEIGGVTLHPGESFHLAIDEIHKDPSEWKEPESFIPERFDHESHFMRKPGSSNQDAQS